MLIANKPGSFCGESVPNAMSTAVAVIRESKKDSHRVRRQLSDNVVFVLAVWRLSRVQTKKHLQ